MKDNNKDLFNICIVYSHDPIHSYEFKHVAYYESKKDYLDFYEDLLKYQSYKGTEYNLYIPVSWLKHQLFLLEKNMLFDIKQFNEQPELQERLKQYNKGISNICDLLNRKISDYEQGVVYE